MTVKEAATELEVSISFVYKLMDAGEIGYEKRGRRKFPVASSVAEYRQRNLVPAKLAPQPTPAKGREPYQFQYLFRKRQGRSSG